jgi:hypothetical protein
MIRFASRLSVASAKAVPNGSGVLSLAPLESKFKAVHYFTGITFITPPTLQNAFQYA